MSSPLNLALTLSLNDRLVGPLQKSFGDIRRTLDAAENDLQNIVRASGRATDGLTKLGQQGSRAGRAVANEMREIGRAAEQADQRVSKLRTALGSLSNLAGKGASLLGGFAAGKAVLSDPMARARAYELDLAKLSNVLYSDRRTVAGRQAGQAEMDGAIRQATKEGVTREDAVAGLRYIGAAGGIDRREALAMLPTLAKFSVAGEASMEDVAGVAVKGMKSYDIKASELPRVLEMALVSGQMGSFEFKDMAHWLPQQMAMAKGMLGMGGVADFGTLLAVNQIASNTAGSSNEAGNNVVNMLGKINSADTANDFKKANIDLPGRLAAQRAKGVNQVDAFLNIIDSEFGKNEGYVKLQKQLQAARAAGDKSGEAGTLEAMQGIMSGSVIGKYLQDRQALMPVLALLNDRGGVERMKKEFDSRQGEASLSQQTLMATSAMKGTLADNAEQARQFDALRDVNAGLADYRVKLAELSDKYPKAAASLEALTLAAAAAAAAWAAFGLGNLVTKGAGGGLAGAAAGAAAGGGIAAAARASGGALGGAMKKVGPLALLSELFFTSDSDVEVLKAAEQRSQGYRGKGFDDPRIIPGFTTGSMEGDKQLSLAAEQHLKAAADLSAAAAALKELKVVPADTALFHEELTRQVTRDARRN